MAASEPLPVAQARAGDNTAWRTLFKRYQLPLYAFVFEMVRHEQTSLDLVQDTFVTAVRHLGGLREDGKFGSWLFGIAHQKYIQHWRKGNRDRAIAFDDELAEIPGDEGDSPGRILLRAEQAAEFRRLLEQLPPPQRAVLVLYFLEDFSLDEIAGITDAQPGTVKSRLHYAKRALRKLWEENLK